MEKVKLCKIVSLNKGKQINGKDLIDNGKYEFLNGGINSSGKWNDFNVNGNSIAISEGGNSCGYVNFMKNKFWCGAHCYYLYDVKGYTKYLYYNLKSNEEKIKALRSGACMPNIRKNDLLNFEIKYTSDINEQKEIVNKLDKIQVIIELRKKQMDELDELIKSQFVEMFGDININNKKWKEDVLKNNLSVMGGYAFKSSEFQGNGIPILKIGNINTGKFRTKDLMFWKEDRALENYLIYPNDVLMSLTGTVGKEDYGNICIIGNEYPKYYLNQRNAKLNIRESLNKEYIAYALRVPEIKRRLTGISRGVRQANISNKDIENLKLPIPPIELQNQFAEIVKQINKQKIEIQNSLEETQKLQESLMNQYF